eukprot:9357108-Lingulodinium_polyedra.AAC.1
MAAATIPLVIYAQNVSVASVVVPSYVFWFALMNTVLFCPLAYLVLQQRRSTSGAPAQREG